MRMRIKLPGVFLLLLAMTTMAVAGASGFPCRSAARTRPWTRFAASRHRGGPGQGFAPGRAVGAVAGAHPV